jgi:hypothetical protein
MAIFGWSTSKMAQHYTRAADRARMGLGSGELLLPGQSENKKRPHLRSGEGKRTKHDKKSDV